MIEAVVILAPAACGVAALSHTEPFRLRPSIAGADIAPHYNHNEPASELINCAALRRTLCMQYS
jgi:hypothetical protein